MAYQPKNPNGQAAMASSAPVVLASDQIQDLVVTGQGGQSLAGNNILLASAGTGSVDTVVNGSSYRSFFCQINASSGIASGQIIFEGSNDNSNWVTLTWFDDASFSATVNAGVTNIAASNIRFFSGKITFRYLRCRISTAFSGGTIQAFTRYSTADYIPRVLPVANSTSVQNLLVSPRPFTLGGNAIYTGSITTTVTSVKSSAGQVYGWSIHNPNAAISYVQFFNTATGSVVLGTTAPVLSIGIPANGTAQCEFIMGLAFSTAISVACTTTRAGLTAPGSSVDLNIFYF